MATFPSVDPSFGASKASKPVVKTAKFGDGYEQRVTFGINQNPKVWELRWQNITEADSDTIEDFLNARAGVEVFEWTPPDETTEYKWVCQDWRKEINFPTRRTISATFRQVFEP